MNFFQAQDQARRGTRRLVVLFILAVLATLLALNAIALAASYFIQANQQEPGQVARFELWQPELYGLVTVVTLAVIFGGSAFKTMQISGDGGKVARLMGGRRVDSRTQDADERKLLNVVEEMSIASGVPVPDVYIMDSEEGINAFAAGSTVNDAAIGVTRGCIQKLNRDELQGVIAHEFSHILNGDMRLNMRLIGILFGILVIGLIGFWMFRMAPYMLRGSSRSRSRNQGGGAAIILLMLAVGAAVWLVGSIGVFFGRMIQASVSRQREFLADASAVQFTRNPVGLRDALRKIGGSSARSKVVNRHAGEIGHMWFGSAMEGMFATHPPLPQRIKAIDPNWDGKMLKAEHVEPREQAKHLAEQKRARHPSVIPQDIFDAFGLGRAGMAGLADAGPDLSALAGRGATQVAEQPARQRTGAMRLQADHVSDRVGNVNPDHIQFAGALMGALPPEVREAAHDPDAARGLIAAMLLSSDPGVRLMQDEAIAQKDPAAGDAASRFGPVLRQIGPAVRLPVLDLCLPALRRIDDYTRWHFMSLIDDLIKADDRVEPFEYALYKLVEQYLSPRKSQRIKWASISAVAEYAQVILSALAAAGTPDQREAEHHYRLGIGRLQQGHLPYLPQFTLEQLDEALNQLMRASPAVKQRLIDAASHVVAADGVVLVEEAELLRAFASVLQCPLPPFIQPAKKAK